MVSVLSQQINRQTGLLDMWAGDQSRGDPTPAIRVVATNLPAISGSTMRLARTPRGRPSPNAPVFSTQRQSAAGVFTNPRAPLTNYTPGALAVPLTTVTPPTTNGTPVTKKMMTTNGILIEFAATIGKTYTIIYTDNLGLTNWADGATIHRMLANRVQWLDNGPPKTISPPTNAVRLCCVRSERHNPCTPNVQLHESPGVGRIAGHYVPRSGADCGRGLLAFPDADGYGRRILAAHFRVGAFVG